MSQDARLSADPGLPIPTVSTIKSEPDDRELITLRLENKHLKNEL